MSRHSVSILAVMVLMGVVAGCDMGVEEPRAATPQPATQKAEGQPQQPQQPRPLIDLSSPKSTAVTFATAINKGDAYIAKLADANVATDGPLIDGLVEASVAWNRFNEVVAARFGSKVISQSIVTGPNELLESFEKARYNESGDSATVSMDGKQNKAFRFVKVGTEWRIQLLFKSAESLSALRLFAKISDDLAREVSEGKYANITEISAAMEEAYAPIERRNMPEMIQAGKVINPAN